MAAARTLKDYDVRRAELLDAAQVLFNEKGYEATTVAAIIAKAGVAKGTFYHYFQSKEVLLEALAERFTEVILARAEAAIAQEPADAVAKLNAFFREAGRFKASQPGVIRSFVLAFYRDENLLLRHMVERQMVARVTPLLTVIIAEGKGAGVFEVGDPGHTAELLMLLLIAAREGWAPLFVDLLAHVDRFAELEQKSAALRQAFERILGARPGSLVLTDPQALAAFKAMLQDQKAARE